MQETNLSREDRKKMHGADYVAKYEKKTPNRIDRILRKISIPHQGTVADFGCGNAILLPLIHNSVSRYFGVDFSDDFIRIAQQRQMELGILNAEFYCGSVQDFCKTHEGFFDAVFALDLSEHVYDEEWQEIVDSMHFSLKPGGKAYLHTPNRDFVIELMKDHDFVLKQFPEHIAVRNGERNAEFFQRTGFADISVTYIPHYNVLRYLHPLSYLPLVGRYFRARILLTATK